MDNNGILTFNLIPPSDVYLNDSCDALFFNFDVRFRYLFSSLLETRIALSDNVIFHLAC